MCFTSSKVAFAHSWLVVIQPWRHQELHLVSGMIILRPVLSLTNIPLNIYVIMRPLMHQLMKIACRWKHDNWLSTHIWYPRTQKTLLSSPCVKCVYSYLIVFSCLSLLITVVHWNCIVFPGGERNCGVHELICVRKGRAGQRSGRLPSDSWPDTLTHTLTSVKPEWVVLWSCTVSTSCCHLWRLVLGSCSHTFVLCPVSSQVRNHL